MAETSEMSGHRLPPPPGSVISSQGLNGIPSAAIAAAVSKRAGQRPAPSSTATTSVGRISRTVGGPSRIQKPTTTSRRRANSPELEAFSPHHQHTNAGPARTHQLATMQQSPHASHEQLQQQQQQQLQQQQAQGPEVPITYTRTGRISKAKKGKPVHECEECGKTYSRAEHLRRHQQNHSSQPLRCNYTGCGKTFHRRDLLDRHRERHDEPEGSMSQPDHGVGPSPRTTPPHLYPVSPHTMGSPAPPMDMPTSMADVSHSAPDSRLSGTHGPMSAPPRYRPVQSHQFRPPQPLGSFLSPDNKAPHYTYQRTTQPGMVTVAPPDAPPGTMWDYPNYSSPSEASPIREYPTGPFEYRPRILSEPTTMEHPWQTYPPISRSPSVASPAIPSYWSEAPHKSPIPPPLSVSPDMNNGAFTPRGSFVFQPQDAMSLLPYQYPVLRTHEVRDREEFTALFGSHPMGTGLHQVQQERYLEAYMHYFHPMYPVVHGSSINMQDECPLLKAAMMALGAQYLDERLAKDMAKSLHERCLKLLQRREQDIPQPLRTCDQQAIFLIEAFKQFRGRRASQQLSKPFNELYHSLSNDPEITRPRVLLELEAQLSGNASTSTTTDSQQTLYQQWTNWNRIASKQRLLLACFILEMNQATLLARPASSFQPRISGLELPFPCATNLFDATTFEHWVFLVRQMPRTPQTYVYEALQELPLPQHAGPYDPFRSSLLIAANMALAISSDATTGGYLEPSGASDHQLPPQSLDQNPATQLAHFTMRLVRQVPLRSLLAVAGETWLPSQKLSQDDYAAAKAELIAWLAPFTRSCSAAASPHLAGGGDTTRVRTAISLALHILRLALESGDGQWGAPGAEMGVYFAALVLWAATTRPVPASPSLPRRSSTTSVHSDPSTTTTLRADLPPPPAPHDQHIVGEKVRVFARMAGEAHVDFATLVGGAGGHQRWWREGVASSLAWVRGRLQRSWPGQFGEVANGAVRAVDGLLAGRAAVE